MEKKGLQIKKCPVFITFFIVLWIGMIVDTIYPDRIYSELENKKLAQKPPLGIKSVFNNEWTSNYTQYVGEQFIFREQWINLYSFWESTVLQKLEYNKILIGKEDMLFPRLYALKESECKQLQKNISVISQFAKKYDGKVQFLLVPSASLIYSDNIPSKAPMIDENTYLDKIFSAVKDDVKTIYLRELFLEAKDQYIYYRTDHHWTTNGAYLAYQVFCKQQNLIPFDCTLKTKHEVNNFYGTSYSASRKWNALPDVITYYDVINHMVIYKVVDESKFEEVKQSGLYEKEKLKKRDKYGMFLYGNNGYSVIKGDGFGKILVIKDSYANCFIPFLTSNYERIDVVDLRNYNYSLDRLIKKEGYNDILILYSFQSFVSDTCIPNLMRPSIY